MFLMTSDNISASQSCMSQVTFLMPFTSAVTGILWHFYYFLLFLFWESFKVVSFSTVALIVDIIIIIMYIYHAPINALSAHMIHINLNMILYTHVKHSPTKTIYIKYYLK